MSVFSKYYFNAFRVKKFYHNINELPLSDCNTETLAPMEANTVDKDEIYNICVERRYNNLKIFTKTWLKLIYDRIVYVGIPISLIATSIATWREPDVKKEVSVSTFTAEDITYDSQYGELVKEEKYYYEKTYDHFFDSELLSETDMKPYYDGPVETSKNDKLSLEVSDDESVIKANFYIDSDGKITDGNLSCDDYVIDYNDYKEYEGYDSTADDSEYIAMYNKVVAHLLEHDYISESSKEILQRINDNEKKRIILNICLYQKSDDETLIYLRNNLPEEIFFTFLATVMTIFAIRSVFFKKYRRTDSYIIYPPGTVNDLAIRAGGRLIADGKEQVGLFFGAAQIKGKFIEAEHQRIMAAKDLLSQHYEESDYKKVLTPFEQKIK